MTSPESGRNPRVVIGADVAPYLRSLAQAEAATRRLAATITRDMAGTAAAINKATVALAKYNAIASGARAIPGARTPTAAAGTTAAAARATAQAVVRAQDEQSRAVERFTDVARKGSDHVQQSFRDMARTAKITAVVLTAGLIVASRAAIEWESAWTGVRKTVDGSPAEMAKLEGELRKLATTLPTTHKEIAGVAEAAGQMGVAKENIADFTKTVVELAATTNLTADAAATGLAKFGNVMGTLPELNKRVASTIVALGNAGASTETEILEMAQRLSGAGKTIGLTEAQVLALSSATSDLGVDAQLGGGALQRVMFDTYKAVKQGGDELERFAAIARDVNGEQMTGAAFGSLFQDDPATAFQALVRGLKQISDSGGNVVAAMSAIGAEGTLDIQVLSKLVAGVDTLNDAFKTSERAWQRPIDLLEEMEKRADTTASKIQVARSQIKDLAIDVGGAVLPDVARGAGAIQDTAKAAQQLPGPLGTITLESAKAVVMLGLLAAAFAYLAPKIAISIVAQRALVTLAPRLAGAIGFLQRRFVLLAAVIAGLGAADVGIKKWTASIDAATGRRADLVELRRSLLDLVDASKEAAKSDGPAKGIQATGEAARLWGKSLQGLAKDIDRVNNKSWGDRFNSFAVKALNAIPDGMELGTAASNLDRMFGRVNDMAEAAQRLDKGLDQFLTDVVENIGAADALAALEVISDMTGKTVEEILRGLDEAAGGSSKFVDAYKKSTAAAEFQDRANKKLADSSKEAGDGMNAAAVDAETFEKAVKKITPGWLDLDKALLANSERWQQIRDDAEEAGERLDDVTDAAGDAADELLDSRARTDAYADSLRQLAEGAEDSFERIRDAATAGIGDAFEAGEAYDGLATSIAGLGEAIADGSIDTSLLGMGEAAIKGRQSVAGLVKEAGQLINSMIPAGASVEQVGEITQRVGGDLERSLLASGLNPQMVQQLLAPLGTIPGEYAKAAAEVRKEAEKAAKEELGAAATQAVEVAQGRITRGMSPDQVDQITGEEANRVRAAGVQRGIDPRVIEESLAPLGRLTQSYRDAMTAEQEWQQSQDRMLEQRVKFGDMLKERLEALEAYNKAAQTNPNIKAKDQAAFTITQQQELAQQMGAMGATPEQIDEFTKPLAKMAEGWSVSKPHVDNSDVLAKNDQSILSGQTAAQVNNWKAKPELDTSGVEAGVARMGESMRQFLNTPEGKAFLATLPEDQRKAIEGQKREIEQGVAGAGDGGGWGAAKAYSDFVIGGLGTIGTFPMKLLPGFASGGRITGPGGPRDDRVPVMASNGEWIIDAAQTRQWMPLLRAIKGGLTPGQFMGGMGPFAAPPMAKTKLKWGNLGFNPGGPKYAGRGGLGPFPGALQGMGPPRFADGGMVGQSRNMWAPPPQVNVTVQAPPAPVQQSSGGQATTVTVPVYLDSRQIATATARVGDQRARNQFR